MAALPPLPQRRARKMDALAQTQTQRPQAIDSNAHSDDQTAVGNLSGADSQELARPLGAAHRRNGTVARVAARRRGNSNSSQGDSSSVDQASCGEPPAAGQEEEEDWPVDVESPVISRKCSGQISRGSSPILQIDPVGSTSIGHKSVAPLLIAVDPQSVERKPELNRRQPGTMRSRAYTRLSSSVAAAPSPTHSSPHISPALAPHPPSPLCSLPTIAVAGPSGSMTDSAAVHRAVDATSPQQRRRSIDPVRHNLISSGIPISNARTLVQCSVDAAAAGPTAYSTPQLPPRRLQHPSGPISPVNRRASLEVPSHASSILQPATQPPSPAKRMEAVLSPTRPDANNNNNSSDSQQRQPITGQHVHRPRRVKCAAGALAPLLHSAVPLVVPPVFALPSAADPESQSAHACPISILSSLNQCSSATASAHSSLLSAALSSTESHAATAAAAYTAPRSRRQSIESAAAAPSSFPAPLSSLGSASPTKGRSRRSSISLAELQASLCTDSDGVLRLVTDVATIASDVSAQRSWANSIPAVELSPASQHMLDQGLRRLQPLGSSSSSSHAAPVHIRG